MPLLALYCSAVIATVGVLFFRLFNASFSPLVAVMMIIITDLVGDYDYWLPIFLFRQGLLFTLATKEVLLGVEANGNPFVFIFLVQGFNDLATSKGFTPSLK